MDRRGFLRLLGFASAVATIPGVVVEVPWDMERGPEQLAEGRVTTFYDDTAPQAEGVGDLWMDLESGDLMRWSGSAWVCVHPSVEASTELWMRA